MQRGFGYQNRRNAGFNPATLFAGGINGAWYDPSDATTLFSDRAGTTPCGTPGGGSVVPVGLMLDKSGNGNHATAANDTTARPELRARVNLLTYSEQFDNAAWVKQTGVSITPNTDIAPDGTLTADTLNSTLGNQTQIDVACAANTLYTNSICFKKTSGATYQPALYLQFYGGTTVIYAVRLNTDTGVGAAVTVGGFTTPTSFSVTDLGAYWRLSITGNSNNNTTGRFAVYPNLSASGAAAAGSQVIWGAQLTATNEFPANTYQRIVDANTYDAVGFPRYLAFNGTSSAMSTPGNVNLSGTDKVTVFLGLRKLNDNNVYVPLEFSNASGWTVANGSFAIYAPSYLSGSFPAPKYFVGLRGSNQRQEEFSTFAAPISNVIAESIDIGAAVGSEISMRINGAVIAPSATGGDAGSANLGNYPLTIGVQPVGTSYFPGNIYSIIVVGSAVSAGQISATEQWVAQRTGITI